MTTTVTTHRLTSKTVYVLDQVVTVTGNGGDVSETTETKAVFFDEALANYVMSLLPTSTIED